MKVYKLETPTGREFRILCENKNQYGRLVDTIKNTGIKMSDLTNGIHTIKQWEQISQTLKNENHG